MADPRLMRPAIGGLVIVILLISLGAVLFHQATSGNRICPEPDHLYHEDSQTCVPEGQKGPCGPNMIITPFPKNISVGICGCDSAHNTRTLIHHAESNECFFVFTKGYCNEGEWINISRTAGPFCEPKKCSEKDGLVPLKSGRCVRLGVYDPESCSSSSQVIQFFPKKIYPACEHIVVTGASIGVGRHGCPNGYFTTQVGMCQPPFDFD